MMWQGIFSQQLHPHNTNNNDTNDDDNNNSNNTDDDETLLIQAHFNSNAIFSLQ